MKIDGGERVVGRAEAFAPAADQLRDQLPLRAAGVLEFVDEHVAVARLEPKAALGEFVELLQQRHRPLEHAGEVEQGVRIERALVLLQRDREDPPDAARHDDVEVAAEAANGVGDQRRDVRSRLRGAASRRRRWRSRRR